MPQITKRQIDTTISSTKIQIAIEISKWMNKDKGHRRGKQKLRTQRSGVFKTGRSSTRMTLTTKALTKALI